MVAKRFARCTSEAQIHSTEQSEKEIRENSALVQKSDSTLGLRRNHSALSLDIFLSTMDALEWSHTSMELMFGVTALMAESCGRISFVQ